MFLMVDCTVETRIWPEKYQARNSIDLDDTGDAVERDR